MEKAGGESSKSADDEQTSGEVAQTMVLTAQLEVYRKLTTGTNISSALKTKAAQHDEIRNSSRYYFGAAKVSGVRPPNTISQLRSGPLFSWSLEMHVAAGGRRSRSSSNCWLQISTDLDWSAGEQEGLRQKPPASIGLSKSREDLTKDRRTLEVARVVAPPLATPSV
jgi:hypothetical protein